MITVSVCMITYNHEKYIAKAIVGVLSQKTSFPFELIIGDDCSTDATSKIISDYQKKFPNRIQHNIRKTNLGGVPNFLQTLSECKGKYIALCEGDDYWTDDTKLQQQVDYLNSHEDCAICFHNASIFDQQSSKIVGKVLTSKKSRYITKDLLQDNPIPTLTCVFRNHLFDSFPSWFSSTFPGDWPLHIINSLYGYADYIDKDMATYRSHENGVTKRLNTLYKLEKYIEMLKHIKEDYLSKSLYPDVDFSISKFEQQLADYFLYSKKDLVKFIFHYFHYKILSIKYKTMMSY